MKDVKSLVKEMVAQKNSNTECSWPVLVRFGDKFELTVFTYFVTPAIPTRMVGYDLIIHCNLKEIVVEDLCWAHIDDPDVDLPINRRIPHKKLLQMFDEYCQELQNLMENNYQYDTSKLNKLFRSVLPPDTYEFYERVCPEFMDMINVHSKKKK